MPVDGPSLRDLLETLDEFGSASRELIAWELGADARTVEALWGHAIEQRLLRATGRLDLGERTYRLTLVGRARLREFRSRSVRRNDGDD